MSLQFEDDEEEEFFPGAGLNLVHPIIIDLYMDILRVNDMGQILDGYRLKHPGEKVELPEDVKKSVADSITKLQEMKEIALEQLGSYSVIDRQINNFHDKTGDA